MTSCKCSGHRSFENESYDFSPLLWPKIESKRCSEVRRTRGIERYPSRINQNDELFFPKGFFPLRILNSPLITPVNQNYELIFFRKGFPLRILNSPRITPVNQNNELIFFSKGFSPQNSQFTANYTYQSRLTSALYLQY